MLNKKLNIIKEKIKFKKKIKIKNLIIKSIIQNKKIKPIIRIYFFYKKINDYKIKKICKISGLYKNVNSLKISRHLMKKYAILNNLQNIKLKSW